MVTLAVAGVLAAIAVPMYTDYISQSQVVRVHSELLQHARAAEILVAEARDDLIVDDPGEAVGFVDSTLSTTEFGSFADEASSTIKATLDGSVSSAIRGTTITLSRGADGSWSCEVLGAGGRWRDAFVPPTCRTN